MNVLFPKCGETEVFFFGQIPLWEFSLPPENRRSSLFLDAAGADWRHWWFLLRVSDYYWSWGSSQMIQARDGALKQQEEESGDHEKF